MEQNQLDRETFSCSFCLDLLKDPVTTTCGHSYCMKCINGYWDKEDQKRIHSCPQCRKTFKQRPVLQKSTMLAALVEQLKKTGLQAAPADHCCAGPEDVACDFCTGRKLKAMKSCLFCLASYCEKHLQPHYDSETLKKHKLVEPSKNLQENICSKHGKVIDIFCRTDQKCICSICSVDEHKGHDTVSAAAERTERQRELEERRGNIQQRIQDREKDVKEEKEKVVLINCSAKKSVEACENICTELIRQIKKKSSDMKKYIKSEQKTEVCEAENKQKEFKKEIAELKREDAELEQLLDTEDDIQFLKNYIPEPEPSDSDSDSGSGSDSDDGSVSKPEPFCSGSGARTSMRGPATRSSGIGTRDSIKMPRIRKPRISSSWCLDKIKAAASEAESTIEQIVGNRWMDISLKEIDSEASSSTPTEGLMDRDELLKYSQELTLDSKTANRYLSVTKTRAFIKDTEQFKDDSERFDRSFQVLSEDPLSGHSYWEVEGSGRFTVAVAYKDIREKGRLRDYTFGLNETSWALECCELMYVFRHNKTLTLISAPRSSQIGVYLDCGAGILSFYSVSGTRTRLPNNRFSFSESTTLLHRVQTRFTQPLHAGIRLYETRDSAEFSQLKVRKFPKF